MYHRLLLLVLIINSAEMYLSCAPGEVAKSYTFTCIFSKNESYIAWVMHDVFIFSCPNLICKPTISDYNNIYEVTISNQSTTLKIKAVTTQSGGNYSCRSFTTEIFNCNLRVYAKPDVVTCQDPELQTETNEVAVVCTVLRVYPNPICQFSWFIDNTESHIIQRSLVEYNNLTGSGDPSYFHQRCSFKIPARDFTRGKHQFQLLAYPDVTGQDNDTVYGRNSNQTSPKYVADPNVTLECSETTVQEGKQFSCTCKETANTFILSNTTLFYGAAKIGSELQQVAASVTAKRNTSDLICQAQLLAGTKANKTQTLQVYFGPTIIIVEDNNNSGQIIIEKKSSVSITCQAEGNPSPSLSLRKDGQEIKKFSDPAHKFNVTLTYNKAMAECNDAGVYMCHAETGQAAADKTVAVYVKCTQQLRDTESLNQIYKGKVNGTVSINVPVFGYPEPTVTLNGTNYIPTSDAYKLNYTKQEPPYGTVSLMINITNASFIQSYSLNINNTEGSLIYSFEIVEGDPVTSGSEKGGSPALDVGAIVGGIVAAILVIILICVIVYLVKRKGAPCRGKKDQNANYSMHAIYENDEPGSHQVLEQLPAVQAPEIPHYEEITDFQSDKPVYYANQILSNVRDEEVEYENTVSGL